jgi:CMP-N-acetylneuraminic acid synthetase
VCEVDHPIAWVGYIDESLNFHGIDLSGKRSQEYKTEYRLNGAVYVANAGLVVESELLFTSELYAYKMPRERSFDIDGMLDFRVCELAVEI